MHCVFKVLSLQAEEEVNYTFWLVNAGENGFRL